MVPQVGLQEGQTQVPLGHTACLQNIRVAQPHSVLYALHATLYSLQPRLMANNKMGYYGFLSCDIKIISCIVDFFLIGLFYIASL